MNLQLVKKEHYFLKKKLVTHLCCWFLATFYFLSLDCLKLICPRMFLFPERQYRSAPLARVDISPRAREGPSLYTFLAGEPNFSPDLIPFQKINFFSQLIYSLGSNVIFYLKNSHWRLSVQFPMKAKFRPPEESDFESGSGKILRF